MSKQSEPIAEPQQSFSRSTDDRYDWIDRAFEQLGIVYWGRR